MQKRKERSCKKERKEHTIDSANTSQQTQRLQVSICLTVRSHLLHPDLLLSALFMKIRKPVPYVQPFIAIVLRILRGNEIWGMPAGRRRWKRFQLVKATTGEQPQGTFYRYGTNQVSSVHQVHTVHRPSAVGLNFTFLTWLRSSSKAFLALRRMPGWTNASQCKTMWTVCIF